jgi:hypothetical protein
MSDEPLYLSFDLVWVYEIIRIEKLDECAARCLIRTIARSASSSVCLPNELNSPAANPLDYVDRPVFRAVIDDNDLKIRQSLTKNGIKRLADVFLGIVARN